MAREKEREFKLDELFFSTTDTNGKILSGNEVFTRVSGFHFSELLNRPHSIIRHPDMPRVVFRLLWDTIAAGKPIAAYVKNRSKDGSYYWVLAFVTNVPGGYLSVRFKPTSQFFPIVEGLYTKLREVELAVESKPSATKDEAIAASAAVLGESLKSHGFSNYDEFIETAFYAEFCNRRTLLDQAPSSKTEVSSPISECLGYISEQLSSILSRHSDFQAMENDVSRANTFITSLFTSVQCASLNLAVRAKKSSKAGAPLAVVANSLRDGSGQIQIELGKVIAPVQHEIRQLKTGLFHISTSQLQVETIKYFLMESATLDEKARGYSNEEARKLMELLALSAEKTFTASLGQLRQLDRAIRTVSHAFSDLKREVMGLCLAQVNGRIECARMTDSASVEAILRDAMTDLNETRAYLIRLEDSFSTLDKLMANFGMKTSGIANKYKELRSACV